MPATGYNTSRSDQIGEEGVGQKAKDKVAAQNTGIAHKQSDAPYCKAAVHRSGPSGSCTLSIGTRDQEMGEIEEYRERGENEEKERG